MYSPLHKDVHACDAVIGTKSGMIVIGPRTAVNSCATFNTIALRSLCLRKAGVGGVTGKSRLVNRVMTLQPDELSREFQTTLT